MFKPNVNSVTCLIVNSTEIKYDPVPVCSKLQCDGLTNARMGVEPKQCASKTDVGTDCNWGCAFGYVPVQSTQFHH
ncbi:hypothetical protein MHBO_003210 [Bonamia ostreae]|uniref:Uncharacterized protein n=1 Tax=Bonamia ostreae TaxID=126728 RepID=A0ABV2APT9_9EUKA